MKKLKNGWVEGSVKDFLDLSDADVEYIELRLALSRLLREVRQKLRLTQMEVAARLDTSQSRLAKMEKADPHRFIRFAASVSLSSRCNTQGTGRGHLAGADCGFGKVAAPSRPWFGGGTPPPLCRLQLPIPGRRRR
jgi:DNA-binding XRE family transcriptional regulator